MECSENGIQNGAFKNEIQINRLAYTKWFIQIFAIRMNFYWKMRLLSVCGDYEREKMETY